MLEDVQLLLRLRLVLPIHRFLSASRQTRQVPIHRDSLSGRDLVELARRLFALGFDAWFVVHSRFEQERRCVYESG